MCSFHLLCLVCECGGLLRVLKHPGGTNPLPLSSLQPLWGIWAMLWRKVWGKIRFLSSCYWRGSSAIFDMRWSEEWIRQGTLSCTSTILTHHLGWVYRKPDTLRPVVRWSLTPLVGMSWMALNIGLIPTLTVIFLMLIFINISFVVLSRRIRLRTHMD